LSVRAAEPFDTLRAVSSTLRLRPEGSEVEPLLFRREEAAFLTWRGRSPAKRL
jgi:hypothetical protein